MSHVLVKNLKLPEEDKDLEMMADAIHLVLRQIRPFLSFRNGRYDYFYESFKLAAQERYVARHSEKESNRYTTQKWHSFLADYFYRLPTWEDADTLPGRKPSERKVSELPYHLTYAEEWKKIIEVLCDLDFIESKCYGITCI